MVADVKGNVTQFHNAGLYKGIGFIPVRQIDCFSAAVAVIAIVIATPMVSVGSTFSDDCFHDEFGR